MKPAAPQRLPKNADEIADDADEATEDADEMAERRRISKQSSEPRRSGVRRTPPAKSQLGVILLAAALVASAGLTAWVYFTVPRRPQVVAAASKVPEAASAGPSRCCRTPRRHSTRTLPREGPSDRRLPYLLHAVHPGDRHPRGEAEGGEDVRFGRSFGAGRDGSRLCGSPGIHQPVDGQQGESRRLVHRERVKVEMKKIDDDWLISSFDPV